LVLDSRHEAVSVYLVREDGVVTPGSRQESQAANIKCPFRRLRAGGGIAHALRLSAGASRVAPESAKAGDQVNSRGLSELAFPGCSTSTPLSLLVG
jgi:hypothetical protein